MHALGMGASMDLPEGDIGKVGGGGGKGGEISELLTSEESV